MGQWWNDTDRGKWGNGGMILTGEKGQWWNGTDRGKRGNGGMILAGENGAVVE